MVIDARGLGWAKTAVAATASWVICGCERMLDLDDQPMPPDMAGVVAFDDVEPVASTGTLQSEWACSDGTDGFDDLLVEPPEPLTLSLDIVDGDTGDDAVVPGLSIVDCARTDVVCFAPRPTKTQRTDEPQHYRFALPFRWGDTLRLTAPGYVDTRYFVDGLLRASRSGDVIEMFSTMTIERFLTELGDTPDTDYGLVFFRFLDCNGDRIPGASVQVPEDRQGIPFHIADGVASSGRFTSDSNGMIGFRVLPGLVLVEGFVTCTNGQLPRAPSPVGYRLHALGALPPPYPVESRTPVCDSNGDALIGRAAVVVEANQISIGEIRPGRG